MTKICATSEQRRKVSSWDPETGEAVGEVVFDKLKRLAGIDYNPALKRLVVAGWERLEEIDLSGRSTCVIDNADFTDIHTVLYTSDDTFIVSCARGSGHAADSVLEVDRGGKELFKWNAREKYGDGLHLNSAIPTGRGTVLVALGNKKKIVEVSREGKVLNEIDVSFARQIMHAIGVHNPVERDGKIWFSAGDAIYIIDKKGKILEEFKGFLNPKGLDFTGWPDILITENHAHKVSVMTREGKLTKRFAVDPYPFRAVWVPDTSFPEVGSGKTTEVEGEVRKRMESMGYLGGG